MNFECQRCGYKSNYLGNIKNHLHKLKECDPILKDISREVLLETYFIKKSNKFPCRSCEKSFSHQSTRSHHEKSCNKKKQEDIIKLYGSKIEELTKEIEKLKVQQPNTTINNNTQNNTINNININAYGTHTPTLSYNELEKLLKIGARSAITRLIENNHFNKEKPENMNFYISNYKDNIGRVYDGETWIMKDGDELVNEIYDLYQSLVDNLIEDITYYSEDETEQQNFKEKLLDKINDTIDTWCKRTNNNKFIDGLKEDLKKHFYSKKAVVKKLHNIKGA
jgi:hypothetical protein